MTLVEYRKKRRFDRSPEPAGKRRTRRAKKPATQLTYVIQKHAARQLHYDFRLEWNGVLKSWAVPKGPSLDPSVKSLAVEVEDHPLEYATFEGIIPHGQYGGGTVMIWDRGTWEPEGDAQKGLSRGKLTFELNGERLRGRWTLIRMSGGKESGRANWLLKKVSDDHEPGGDPADILSMHPLSVATQRSMDEIAQAGDRVWDSDGERKLKDRQGGDHRTNGRSSRKPKRHARRIRRLDASGIPGARRGRMPKSFKPQLATLMRQVPAGDDWLHEIKFDGYRLICSIDDHGPRLLTRHGNDWTDRFPTVADALRRFEIGNAILDGEVVVLASDGTSDFQSLQNLLQEGKDDKVVFYVFDLPFYDGFDLTDAPLIERKLLLRDVLSSENSDGVVRFSDHIVGNGEGVLRQTCRHALEGVISKRRESRYEQQRSSNWVKVKCLKRQEFVIGGWTDPGGSREGFGALLLGVYDNEKRLTYCGRVGTGFTSATLHQTREKLEAVALDESAFWNPPSGYEARGCHWVEPILVAEVEFSQWTRDGHLRHPVFLGLREDKAAGEITREVPADSTTQVGARAASPKKKTARGTTMSARSVIKVAGVSLTNPDRIIYPEKKLTKHDLAEYYEKVAGWILPHLVHRPLTVVRCPRGRQAPCFYQKHVGDSLVAPVRGIEIPEEDGVAWYVAIDDLPGLVTLVQMGVLEIHPWGAREDNLDRPDRLILDLDPGEGVAWGAVISAAEDMHSRLAELSLESFVRTTGGKGLHIVVPLTRRASWELVKEVGKEIAESLVRQKPGEFIAIATKAKRHGKIYVDYLRNNRGATAVASYSTRAREGAPVATPLRWQDLSVKLNPARFNVETVPEQLSSGADPWEGFFDVQQAVTKSMVRKVKGW